MKIVTTLTITLFAITCLMAQTGQHDVQLVQQHLFECGDGIIYFDIQVKAFDATTTFRVAEQNYRFDYDSLVLTNPQIDQELGFSGVIDDGVGISLYSPHTTHGTLGGIISYNVELLGGPGYLLTDTWESVGRIAFDIVDSAGCANLVWRTQADYPITTISEIANDGTPLQVSEGDYNNYSGCLANICATACPVSLNLSSVIVDDTYQANISITSNGTIPNGGVVDYKAGDFILLDNGFSAEAQADFSAAIDGCN